MNLFYSINSFDKNKNYLNKYFSLILEIKNYSIIIFMNYKLYLIK